MNKSQSPLWAMAKRYEKLKNARNFRAIDISPDGTRVAFQAMIYGNCFTVNETELRGMLKRAGAYKF